MQTLTISQRTRREFLLGKQGLYPGRRWRGKAGVAAALRAGVVVQIDPINVVARSHDIVLYGRVLDYQPALLQSLLYEDRDYFETGGNVQVHPIEELPYFRVVMARKGQEARHAQFAEEHAEALEMVRQSLASEGPRSTTDFTEPPRGKGKSSSFRSEKLASQALYHLWLTGETLTHHRQRLERVYDLCERVVPAQFNVAASADDADAFFALKVLQRGGMLSIQQWRSWFSGTIARPVALAEAVARVEALEGEGKIARVLVGDDPRMSYLLPAEDLPLLEQLHAGHLPEEWQPMESVSQEEMTFLAPLEIVSARGRARELFNFEYLWEVYKPQEQRRWGYYTLPILYREGLVARSDLKLDRDTSTLVVKGFWLEEHAVITGEFSASLAHAFQRFMRFAGADKLDSALLDPAELREGVERVLTVPE